MSDESFAPIADVARSARAVRRDLGQFRRSLVTALDSASTTVPSLRRLPRLHLPLSDVDAAGAVLEGLTTNQPWPLRYRAVAVIELPRTFDDYLRGRSMQAARTNRRRACERGLSVVRADSISRAQQMLAVMLDDHALYLTVDEALARHLADERKEVWFVCDAQQTPVGVAVVAVDDTVAQLTTLQIVVDLDGRSEARYLLSTELVRDLIAEERKYLVADSMLLAEPGVVYLQRRLGFVPMRIVVPRRLRWRRAIRAVATRLAPRTVSVSAPPSAR